MAFLDKVQDFVKSASDKTSEVIEVSKLKGSIAEEKKAISEQMGKLGAIFYAQYKGGACMSPEAANICMLIDKHNARVEESEAKIRKINEANAERKTAQNADEVECMECHSMNPEGTRFCTNCGAKIPEIVEASATEAEEAPAEEKGKRHCGNCGAEVSEKMKFCGECGTKME